MAARAKPKRKRLATYGRRGQLVRVFDETASGRRLVRVQWNETKGAPLSTESWPYSRENVETAKGYAQGVDQRLAAGLSAPLADRTVRQLADAHIAAFDESWAPATLRNFRHRWARFEAFVGRNTSARLITEETLDEFRARMRALKVVTNQRTETIKAVKQCFRWARRRKLIAENPIADYTIKLSKSEKIAEVPEWSPIDTARLGGQLLAEGASRSSRHWRLEVGFFLAASQGPRINALLHLAWDDVNLSGKEARHPSAAGVVLPPRTVWWNPAFDKTGSERVQPLTRGAVRALRIARVWRARIEYAGPWVFAPARVSSAKQGESWGYSAANYALRELCDRCQPAVDWVKGRAFHGFRKHSAGEIHRLTGSERSAADWIGDKDVKVVRKHYLKKRAEEQRGVAQKIDVDAGAQAMSQGGVVPQVGLAPGRRKPIEHGTRTGYGRGCRCEPCTAAQRDHIRAVRGTKPEHFKIDRPTLEEV
jgi:integrase